MLFKEYLNTYNQPDYHHCYEGKGLKIPGHRFVWQTFPSDQQPKNQQKHHKPNEK